MAERGEEQFLRNIDNPDNCWVFELVGNRVLVGFVLNYIMSTKGQPLSLMLKLKEPISWDPPMAPKYDYVEVPWTIVQTIKKHKESK